MQYGKILFGPTRVVVVIVVLNMHNLPVEIGQVTWAALGTDRRLSLHCIGTDRNVSLHARILILIDKNPSSIKTHPSRPHYSYLTRRLY